MTRDIHQPTLALMTAICILAFALRVWNISITDYDVDEAWTFDNIRYAQNPETFSQINREPNNTLHILTVLPLASYIPEKIGFRFWSIAAGVLSVAVIGRLAFRLFGREAAWIAALISALSYFAIDLSQHVRPYMLANLCGVTALLMWVERKKRLDMLFSALTPMLHVGAFPIVMIEDVMTLWRIIRRDYVNIVDWVIRRVPPYTMLLLILYLVYLRGIDGKVISSGQTTPTALDLLTQWMFNTHGNDTLFSNTLFWCVAIACLVATVFYYRSGKLNKQIVVPLLWIGLSYGILIIMTIISDGPIKFNHISHVAFATALIFAAAFAHMPRIARYSLLGLLVVANIISLVSFYTQPFQGYTNAYHALTQWNATGQPIYFRTVSPVQALALARPLNASLDWLIYIGEGGEATPVTPYRFLAYSDFDPEFFPKECEVSPIWVYEAFHLHECQL